MKNQKFLGDTHCLIWFQENNPKIPAPLMEELQYIDNTIFFSQLSLFEIAIKQKIDKLPLFSSSIEEIFQQAIRNNFTFLPIHNTHLFSYNKIPFFKDHRDPFDRLLIATAFEENLTMLTADKNFDLYKNFIHIIW